MFCLFNSVTRSSFAASSWADGIAVDRGPVTPCALTYCEAMVVVSPAEVRESELELKVKEGRERDGVCWLLVILKGRAGIKR